ncbi:hypothetical protein LXL04_036766 [Taraxacum kok-saghyz]
MTVTSQDPTITFEINEYIKEQLIINLTPSLTLPRVPQQQQLIASSYPADLLADGDKTPTSIFHYYIDLTHHQLFLQHLLVASATPLQLVFPFCFPHRSTWHELVVTSFLMGVAIPNARLSSGKQFGTKITSESISIKCVNVGSLYFEMRMNVVQIIFGMMELGGYPPPPTLPGLLPGPPLPPPVPGLLPDTPPPPPPPPP